MNTIGDRIKKAREAKNYTQEHVATMLSISQNAYSKIETGGSKVTAERLLKLAEVLDVPVEKLICEEQKVFNFNNNEIAIGYIDHLENSDKENMKILHEQIRFQQKEIERLIALVEKLTEK